MKKTAKKSIFLMILMILLIFFSSLLFFSCGKEIKIERIEFANTFSKMYVSESRYIGYNVYPANANNYYVTISSSDKSIVGIDREGFAIAVGIGTATITLNERETGTVLSFDIEVGDGEVYSISYDFLSLKPYYYEGEKIDISTLIVYRNFDSGKREVIPNDEYTVEYPEFASMDSKIKILYIFDEREFVKEINLPVIEDEIDSISVISPPDKTTYNYGETFDKQGLKVVSNMKSGRALEVENFTFDTNPIDVGQTEVKIYYQDFETSVSITSKAEVEVSTFNDLMNALSRNVKSIKLNGKHSFSNPVIFENINDIIIEGGDDCEIVGNGIAPVKFIGNCAKIRIINITFKTSNTENNYCVDVDEFESGTVTFENCEFSSSSAQETVSRQVDGFTFTNCKFQ